MFLYLMNLVSRFLKKLLLIGCWATTCGAIALSYSPRVRVRATVKLSAAFFHDESSITIGGGGVRKCNSALLVTMLPALSKRVYGTTAGFFTLPYVYRNLKTRKSEKAVANFIMWSLKISVNDTSLCTQVIAS